MRLFVPADRPLPRDIRSLTSLRFFAAFWVLSLHYTDIMPLDFSTLTGVFERGKLGVDFFFVLSGFILTHVYFHDIEGGRFDVLRFLQKRLARLYPLHVVTFLLVVGYVLCGRALGLGFSVPEAYTIDSIVPNLLLIHAWGTLDHMSWNYVSWSISAEWFAYLLFFPLALVVLMARGPALPRVALAIVLLCLLYGMSEAQVGRPLTHLTHDFGILRIFPEFLLGMCLHKAARDWDLGLSTGVVLLAGTVILLVMVVHWNVSDLLAVLLLAFVIFAVASLERQGRLRLLARPAWVYLGEISYSLYMTHAIVFIVFFKGLSLIAGASFPTLVWLTGPVALALCFITAALGYHLIEMPGRRFFSRRPREIIGDLRGLLARAAP